MTTVWIVVACLWVAAMPWATRRVWRDFARTPSGLWFARRVLRRRRPDYGEIARLERELGIGPQPSERGVPEPGGLPFPPVSSTTTAYVVSKVLPDGRVVMRKSPSPDEINEAMRLDDELIDRTL